ncbi:hypothetical protein JHN63_32065 [Streptomyces sp. MBT65]|nr:hypothetical protein [Streptomyces sp. MBT65]MBK3578358.1 hypothetical protein [Streptomyces sp. MBT65]
MRGLPESPVQVHHVRGDERHHHTGRADVRGRVGESDLLDHHVMRPG